MKKYSQNRVVLLIKNGNDIIDVKFYSGKNAAATRVKSEHDEIIAIAKYAKKYKKEIEENLLPAPVLRNEIVRENTEEFEDELMLNYDSENRQTKIGTELDVSYRADNNLYYLHIKNGNIFRRNIETKKMQKLNINLMLWENIKVSNMLKIYLIAVNINHVNSLIAELKKNTRNKRLETIEVCEKNNIEFTDADLLAVY